jgi:hypothetical protein
LLPGRAGAGEITALSTSVATGVTDGEVIAPVLALIVTTPALTVDGIKVPKLVLNFGQRQPGRAECAARRRRGRGDRGGTGDAKQARAERQCGPASPRMTDAFHNQTGCPFGDNRNENMNGCGWRD